MDAALLEQILDGVRWTRRLNCIGVAGLTLVLVDLIHTFPDEVRYMWRAPMSVPKVLFFVLRYYMIAHLYFVLAFDFPLGLSPEDCKIAFTRNVVSSALCVVVSEWVLFIRVWAFSGRDRRVLAFLAFQAIGPLGGGLIAILVLFDKSVTFVQFPFSDLPCLPAQVNDALLSGAFALVLWSVLTVNSIMIYLAFKRHQEFKTSLFQVFYRDGVFYMVLMSILALLNISINVSSARSLKWAFTQIEVISHGLLATRMLLQLRQTAEKKGTVAIGHERFPSTIHFSTRPGYYNSTWRG